MRIQDMLGIILLIAIAYYTVGTIDQIWMVNGSYYPAFFAERITVPLGDDAGIEGLMGICNSTGGWDFYEKENGYFLRCQTMINGSWTIPKTYLIENAQELFAAVRKVYG